MVHPPLPKTRDDPLTKIVAADTETRGLDWFDHDHRAFLATWADEKGSYAAWENDADAVSSFLQALREADTLVFHNASFDVHQIRERWGFDCLTDTDAQIVDTNELGRVAVPERKFGWDDDDETVAGYKLKNLAKTYLRKDAGDSEYVIEELARSIGVKLKGENATPGAYYEVGRAYPEQMETYAKVDTELTRDLLPVLMKKLKPGTRPVWELEQRVQPHLIRAEQRGVRVDQSKVIPLKADFERRAEQAHDLVTKELGDEALTGNDALLEALLSHGVPLYRKTPTGKTATHAAALAEFNKDFPVLEALTEWRTATKFLSTYISPMVGREVVHTSFGQQTAWTGRMSARRPNMQNIPVRAGAEVREVFVPREGHCFVVCDYDSIELRLLAYYLNDDAFKERVERGDDLFAELAAILPNAKFGRDPANYRKGAIGESQRSAAKNTTYAITYGAGGGKVADMQDPPLDPSPFYGPDHPAIIAARAQGREWPREGWQNAEGRALASTVKSWLPGYPALQRQIKRKVKDAGHVTTIMGRYQPIGPDKAYVGLNALIQGSAADIMKVGVSNVAEAVKPLGALPVLFVHDECVVECPIEEAQECLKLTSEAMTAAYDLTPGLAVSGKVCFNSYGEAK